MMIQQEANRSAEHTRNTKLWRASIFLLLCGLAFFAFSSSLANIDLWGHLRVGLDILNMRGIPRIDSYSYLTTGSAWINHEWLAQVFFALAWLSGNIPGLVALKLILGFLTIGLFWWNFYLQRVDPLAGAVVIFIGIILLASDFSTIYPQIFSLPALAALFFIILRADEGEVGWLWAAPMLFLFWVNMHGGFLVGLGFFMAWVLMSLVRNGMDWKKLLLPAGACLLVTFINPFGIQLYTYLLRSFSDARPEIWVWSALTLFSPFGIIYIFSLVVSIISFIYSRRHRSTTIIILFGIAALMPFLAKRNLSLFAVATVMLAGEHIADVLMRGKWMRQQSKGMPTWMSGVVLVITLGLFLVSLPGVRSISINTTPPYPIQAVELIKESQVKGNLAIEYNWGGYVIWHLGPDVKVSIDGRRETVYSPAAYEKAMFFLLGLNRWDALLTDDQTDLVLINDHSPVYNLMRYQPGWTLVFEDEAGALYVRKGSDSEGPLLERARTFSPITDSGTFP